jgi:hypothetical protein
MQRGDRLYFPNSFADTLLHWRKKERNRYRHHNGRNDRLEIRVTWGAGAVVRIWYLVDVTTGRHAEMRQLAVSRAWEVRD